MQDNMGLSGKTVDAKSIVDRGGPVVGSGISIVGALLVLLGFVLPWASCGNFKLSGLDIVTQSLSGELSDMGNSSGTLLCLVPFFALGTLGVALLVIPSSLWKKIPSPVKLIGTCLAGLFTVLGCCPTCLFFTNIQSSRRDAGGFIQIEYGFWITVFGLAVSFLGVLVGIGTSVASIVMSRKTTVEGTQ